MKAGRKGYRCILISEDTGKEYHFISGREASYFLHHAKSYVTYCAYHGLTLRHGDTGERFTILYPDQREEGPKPKRTKEQLCCSCRKAYGGCAWSARFEPVEGWEANPTIIKQELGREIESYEILKCPEYERG